MSARTTKVLGPNPWPSTTWKTIGRGHRWLCYRRGPTSFVWVKEAGADERDSLRLYLGHPLPVDPAVEYEIRNCGFLTDALVSPANLAVTAQPTETLPGVTPLIGDDQRRSGSGSVIVSSPEPLYGGHFYLRARLVGTATQSAAVALRTTVEGLQTLRMRTYVATGDSLAAHWLASSEGDFPNAYSAGFDAPLIALGALTAGNASVAHMCSTGNPAIFPAGGGSDYKAPALGEQAKLIVSYTHSAGLLAFATLEGHPS